VSDAPGGEAAVTETEQWFVGRGLPHFIEDYSASRDVFTRTVPLLALVFVIEVLANAPNSSYPFWKNAIAVASGFALVIAVWTIANALRHRPLFARPDRFGPIELALFVLGPGLIALPFGGQWRSTLATVALNLILLGAIYLVTSYGIIPMTRWAVWQTLRQVETVVGLYVRSLPLLLLFVSFLFLTNEVWQVSASLVGPWYWIVLAFFPLMGTLFAVMRLPKEVGRLAEIPSSDTLSKRVRGTPVEGLVAADGSDVSVDQDLALSKRQWGNIGLVVLFSQGVQVVLVIVMVFAVLVGFGLVVATKPIVIDFLGGQPNVLAHVDLWDRHMVLTEELLRISGFLAVFSGFYFTVAVLTEDTYREEFLAAVVTEVGRALAVRAVYLRARANSPGAPAVSATTISPT
jgi:hypothetical protein